MGVFVYVCVQDVCGRMGGLLLCCGRCVFFAEPWCGGVGWQQQTVAGDGETNDRNEGTVLLGCAE